MIRQVLESRAKLLQQLDHHPDRSTSYNYPYRSIMTNYDKTRWFRSDLEPLYKEAVGEVADFVGAQPDNIVISMIMIIGIMIIMMMIMMMVVIMWTSLID